MKTQIIRHGEVLLKPISEIPQAAKLVKTGKSHIVAHSETGHHHVLELKTSALKIFELDGKTYLEVEDIGNLVHKKTGADVHKSHVVAPGKYEVVIKKAFNYFSKALEKVRD